MSRSPWSQSRHRRYRALPRLPRGRHQPSVPGAAGPGRHLALRFLGRRHVWRQALAAVDLARAVFPRMSFDLIYARPARPPRTGKRTASAIELAADHLSVYQLTIEPGTAFHPAHARGDFVLPTRMTAAELFDLTQALTAARPAGLRDLQPCPAGRRMPAQPALLAGRRLSGHRSGRPWPPDRSFGSNLGGSGSIGPRTLAWPVANHGHGTRTGYVDAPKNATTSW